MEIWAIYFNGARNLYRTCRKYDFAARLRNDIDDPALEIFLPFHGDYGKFLHNFFHTEKTEFQVSPEKVSHLRGT